MNNTIYYAAELMVYFEKHHFLEVVKALLIRLAIDRPHSLKYYIKKNLHKIANSVLTKNTVVHLPPEQDIGELEKSILKIADIPLLIYSQKNEEMLFKFKKHCQRHGTRNKLILDCPENFDGVLQTTQKCNIMTPTNFINLTLNNHNTEVDFDEVFDFNRNLTKQIPTSQSNRKSTVLAAEILHKIKYAPIPAPYGFGCNYVYRIVIIGRRGSGRQTQAKQLAARYNLVYVNIESLIEQTLQSKDNMAKVLSIAFEKQNYYSSSAVTALIWKRLMMSDTLSRGWVIVNFPKCINELIILVKKFQIPPNRFVILHCSQRIALRRLIKQWETSKTEIKFKNTVTQVEKEFAEYDQNIGSIYSYLKSACVQTIHVNGRGCFDFVKNKIFALLER